MPKAKRAEDLTPAEWNQITKRNRKPIGPPDPDVMAIDSFKEKTEKFVWVDTSWLEATKNLQKKGYFDPRRLQALIDLAPKMLALKKLDVSLRKVIETFLFFAQKAANNDHARR